VDGQGWFEFEKELKDLAVVDISPVNRDGYQGRAPQETGWVKRH